MTNLPASIYRIVSAIKNLIQHKVLFQPAIYRKLMATPPGGDIAFYFAQIFLFHISLQQKRLLQEALARFTASINSRPTGNKYF